MRVFVCVLCARVPLHLCPKGKPDQSVSHLRCFSSLQSRSSSRRTGSSTASGSPSPPRRSTGPDTTSPGNSVRISCVTDPVRSWGATVCTKCALPTRSSAQGNCSAKSLAGNVVDSSLSSLSSTSHAVLRGVWGQGGSGWGKGVREGGLREEGVGDISSTLPYTALPHGALPQRDFAQQCPGVSRSGAVHASICRGVQLRSREWSQRTRVFRHCVLQRPRTEKLLPTGEMRLRARYLCASDHCLLKSTVVPPPPGPCHQCTHESVE